MAYILHIKNGTIHSFEHPCGNAKRMKESNKQIFEKYEDAKEDLTKMNLV